MRLQRLLLLLCATPLCLAGVAQQRVDISLNRAWRFIRQEVKGAEQPGFDDSAWRTVNLPHDAQIEGKFQKKGDGASSRVGFLPLGKGVYRKTVNIKGESPTTDPSTTEGRERYVSWLTTAPDCKVPVYYGAGGDSAHSPRYILVFEGVFRNARLFVNGQACGGVHRNGYLGFETDVTDRLHDGDNVIAVTYDNTYTRASRWYNGEGINRDVYLRVVSPLHVKRLSPDPTPYCGSTPYSSPSHGRAQNASGMASAQSQQNGMALAETGGNGVIKVETLVQNSGNDSVLCQIVTDIIDQDGRTVASRRAVAPFGGGETYTFRQQLPVAGIHLWNVGAPYLYKAVSRVSYIGSDGQPVLADTLAKAFGLRTIAMTPDSGLAVNGRRVYVNGVCLHTDLGPLGTASFTDAWDKRLGVIRDSLGCNAIRLSHNVYPEYVLDWADRHGVLVFDEFFDKWADDYYGRGSRLNDSIKADFAAWINRDKHHPSVFIWGVGNEVYEQIEWNKTQRYGISWLKSLVSLAHNTDPTRLATVGQYPNRYGSVTRKKDAKLFYASEPHPFAFYSDVCTTNYLERFWDRDHTKYPQLIFLESEMAVGDLGYDFFNFDHSYPVGQFYWGGTDYIGESFGWPAKGWVRGLIDFTNRLKPLGQSVRSFYTATPMTHIVTRPEKGQGSLVWNDLKMTWIPLEEHWNYRQGDTLKVQVMSNCDVTELFLNGKSLGRKLRPIRLASPANPLSKGKGPAIPSADSIAPLRRTAASPSESGGGGAAPEYVWTVPYAAGTLRAVGYNGGRKVSEETLTTAGKPARIVARVDSTVLSAHGDDLAYIDYTVTDRDGNVCPVPVSLQLSVKGPVTIAGVASGNMLSDEPWQVAPSDGGQRAVVSRTTYGGRCQLIVRSGYTAGKAVVTARAKGLKAVTTTITVR